MPMIRFNSLDTERGETRFAGATLCGVGLLLGAAMMDDGAMPEYGIPPAEDEFGTLAKGRRRGLAMSAAVVGLGLAIIAKPDTARAAYEVISPVLDRVAEAINPQWAP